MPNNTEYTLLTSGQIVGDELIYCVSNPATTQDDRTLSLNNAITGLLVAQTDQNNDWSQIQKFDSGSHLVCTGSTGLLVFSGGSSSSSGGNIRVFGESHATSANKLELRAGTTVGVEVEAPYVRMSDAAGDTDTGSLVQMRNTATGKNVLKIDCLSGTSSSNAIDFNYAGTQRGFIRFGNASTRMNFLDFDNGTSTGCELFLNSNNNATTPAPAALKLKSQNGATQSFYLGNDDVTLMVYSGAVTNSTSGSGSAVGAQTSYRASKDIISEVTDSASALQKMLAAKVYDFVYKKDVVRFDNPDHHVGIIADETPWLTYTAGGKPVFDPVSLGGYTILSIKALFEKINILEEKLEALGGAS